MLVHGIDNNDNVIPLLLDASGNVIVSASQLTTTGGKWLIDGSGRQIVDFIDPSALKPSQVATQSYNPALPAGNTTFTNLTVPAGQLYQIDVLSMVYIGAVAGTTLDADLFTGGVLNFASVAAVVTGQWYTFDLGLLFDQGQSLRLTVGNAAAGSVFIGNVFGRRIR